MFKSSTYVPVELSIKQRNQLSQYSSHEKNVLKSQH